jgi:CheY-like chemotaxis protein
MGKVTKILLVEDHADTADVVASLLRETGYEVRAARTCAEARASAEAEPFDLLLCDIGLPDGDGCDLMKQLAARHGLKGVAMSAHIYPEDRQRCLDAGFARFVAKPFTLQELLEAVAAAATP